MSFHRSALAATITVALIGSSSALTAVSALAAVTSPAITDTTSAATEALAAQTAQKYGHSVVIDADTTATSQVSALPNGQRQLVESTTPVRVKRGTAWVPVDLSLALTSSGMIEPKASAIAMSFSNGGSGPLATIASGTGQWLTERWPLGSLPVPRLSGVTATYADVLPGVDLTLTATGSGLSQVLVERDASAASDPRLSSLTEQFAGMTLSGNADGTEVATASDGSKLTSSVTEFWDSSSAGASISGPGGGGSAQPLTGAVTVDALSTNLVAAAGAGKHAFPVYIGASWGPQATGWFIDQGYPGTDFRGHSFLKVGRAIAADSSDGVDHLARSFWQFPMSGISGVDVTAAQFSDEENWGGSGQCIYEPVDLYRSDAPAGYTWNTGNPNLDSLESSASGDARNTAACPDKTLGFDVSEAARWSASNSGAAITLTARARDEGEGYSIEYKQFDPTGTLTVTYNTYPNIPTQPAFTSPERACGSVPSSPTYVNNAVQPLTMRVSSTDNDGDNLSTTFTVANAVSGAVALPPISSPLQGQGSVAAQIRQGALANGLYYWTATASDGLDTSRGASAPCYFEVENSGPGLPGVKELSSGGIVSPATGTVGRPMSVQLTGSALGTTTAQFGYWWTDGTPTSPSPAPPVTSAPENSQTGAPACPAAIGAEHFVCANASGSAVVSVGPIDAPHATLWVAAYDAYGNLSKNLVDVSDVSHASGLRVTAASDANHVQYKTAVGGDLWRAGDYRSATGIADENATHTASGMAETNAGVIAAMPEDAALNDKKTLDFSGQTALNTYKTVSSQFVTVPSWDAPAGSVDPIFQGWITPYPDIAAGRTATPPAGMVTLYECVSSTGVVMNSTSNSCENTGMTASPLGFIWAKASSTTDKTKPISRCGDTGFDVRGDVVCPGGVPTLLGYADITEDDAYATDTTAFTDDSKHGFTYSAWVDPDPNGALSAADTDSHVAFAYDGVFQLVDTAASRWNLCWNDMTAPTGQSCLVGPKVKSAAWTYVSVSWDSSNDQMRLTTNGKVSDALVAARSPQSGYLITDHIVSVGSAYPNGGDVWNGYIDDVSGFPGVADATELAALMNESAPQ